MEREFGFFNLMAISPTSEFLIPGIMISFTSASGNAFMANSKNIFNLSVAIFNVCSIIIMPFTLYHQNPNSLNSHPLDIKNPIPLPPRNGIQNLLSIPSLRTGIGERISEGMIAECERMSMQKGPRPGDVFWGKPRKSRFWQFGASGVASNRGQDETFPAGQGYTTPERPVEI